MLLQLLRRFNAHTQHTARQDPAHRDEQTQENPQNDDQRFFGLTGCGRVTAGSIMRTLPIALDRAMLSSCSRLSSCW